MMMMMMNLCLSIALLASYVPLDSVSAYEIIRGRIDWTRSSIVLVPQGVEAFQTKSSGRFVRDDFVDALAIVNGTEVTADIEAKDDWWKAESRYQTAIVDINNGLFEVRDSRAYRVADGDSSGVAVLSGIEARVSLLLEGSGVSPEESVDQETRGLAGADSDRDIHRRLATKVFVKRSVAGLRVAGERLVFSFANDGSFRKMLGQWRAVDYSRSRLSSPMTMKEFEDAAITRLVKMGLADDAPLPIVLGTHYVVEKIDEDAYILILKGFAHVTLQGPTGTKPGIYDFDL